MTDTSATHSPRSLFPKSLFLMTAALLQLGCGSPDACFYECTDKTTCTSRPDISQAECNAMAQNNCGGDPQSITLMTGCSCPEKNASDACQAPDWYGGSSSSNINACFHRCSQSTGCHSATGLTQAECDAAPETECQHEFAGTPVESVFMTGCRCPGHGADDECSDSPDWYQP